jgi:hypothetical protein
VSQVLHAGDLICDGVIKPVRLTPPKEAQETAEDVDNKEATEAAKDTKQGQLSLSRRCLHVLHIELHS